MLGTIFRIQRVSTVPDPEVKVCSGAFWTDDREWCIYLITIDELLKLISEVGKVIVENDRIYIYDDYIE